MSHSKGEFILTSLITGSSLAIAKTIQAPLTRVKLLLQLQAVSTQITPKNQYRGICNALVRIPKEQGLRAYWRGNGTAVLGAIASRAITFSFREYFLKVFASFGTKTSSRSHLGSALTGAAAGAATVCCTYPLDVARIRLSLDVGVGKNKQFLGLWDCVTTIFKRDGIKGLYQGVTVAFLGIAVYRGAYFGGYDALKGMMPNPENTHIIVNFALAQVAVLFAGIISYPLDTVRGRMIMQCGRPKPERMYNGMLDCVQKIYRCEGAKGFYKGGLCALLQGTTGVVMLVLYDYMR